MCGLRVGGKGWGVSVVDGERQGGMEELSARLLGFRREAQGRLVEWAGDEVLQSVAGDLGEVLVGLSRDERLRELTSGAPGSWRSRSLRSQLGQLLVIDWAALLDQAGYDGEPPAEEFAEDFLQATARFAGEPTPDSYEQVRAYLFDLGSRLLDDAEQLPETPRRRSRLARAVGRGLWVVGRVGLAAAVGIAVSAVVPPAGPLAGAAVYAATSEVAKEMAKALVEEVVPEPRDGSTAATRESLEFDERAAILSELLRPDELGRLQTNWATARAAGLFGDDLHSLPQTTLAWCSAAQAATLTMRSLGAALWNGIGDQTLDSLARQLGELRSAVRNGDPGHAAETIDIIGRFSFHVYELLEDQHYRNHP